MVAAGAGGAAWLYVRSRASHALGGGPFRHYPFDPVALENFQHKLFILALTVGGALRATLGKVPGALITGGVVAVIAWFVVGAVSMALLAGVVALIVTLLGGGMLGRGMGGLYGGGGRGGGGGGFSGGGGGFGGGGASGRW